MRFYWFLLGVLSVWRLSHLLFAEDGPWDILVRMRRWVGEGFWGKLLDCFYCLSLWIAAPFAFFIGEALKERLLLWLALSGGAILIERVAFQSDTLSPDRYVEDEERHHELLRPEEGAVSPGDLGSDNP
jgi:hypothetical protein